ncbi:hypothetical protein ACJDU8_24525 [Clostridium sp. WILCCON 0269]|uniref:Restriction endonuclease type IV Mrr domain-containing protein n=1 Tax=Candidatus Clostridium eludens TaxID=3381663 RepID=A0ABW8SRU0_9CLOT
MSKYEIPKILLVDVDNSIKEKLLEDGFNIDIGTLGHRYNEVIGCECGLNYSLPCLTEKNIIIVDMKEDNSLGVNPFDSQPPNGDHKGFIMPKGSNFFNPRYLSGAIIGSEFEKVVNNGGILIAFADKKYSETYYQVEYSYGTCYSDKNFNASNYDWMPCNSDSITNCIVGKEIYFNTETEKTFKSIFSNCENDITYHCTINNAIDTEHTTVICKNNLNEPISFILKYNPKENNSGYLIVLPQFKDIYKPIKNLFNEFLPLLKPELFPDFVKNSWVNTEEYILPEVKKLDRERENLVKEYEQKLKELEKETANKKSEYEFLTNLLISDGYDDFLVDNVKKTLEHIGYESVVTVDDLVEGNRQEDLRILDNGQFTVVEIKGHNGNPTEDDCQALVKYISRNMKSMNRTDIHGILIINHHKLKAPLDRPYPAFTEQQISDAIRDDYTLVSTWELYKSVRLLQEGLITFDDINTGLHTKGLFTALPTPWQFIGKIQHQFDNHKISCFYSEADTINIGDELIIENGNDYFRINVDEMMVDCKAVTTSKKGDKLSINIKTPILKQSNIYVRNK